MRASKCRKSHLFLLTILLFTTVSFAGANPNPEKPLFSELIRVDSIYQKAKTSFEDYVRNLYADIDDDDISYELFFQGLTGYHNMLKRGELQRPDILTLIDFSRASSEPRFYIIDLCERKVLHASIVAHGSKSGGLFARHFSNDENSHQSSLGFYSTGTTYTGKYDLALRLNGKEHSNSHASSRGVVMHAAKYATYEFLDQNGCTLGRSFGCPALPFEGFEQVVEWIKGGTCLYIYYPSRSYKRHSKYLNRRGYLQDFVSY